MSEPAIVTLTPRGYELGQRLAHALGRGEVLRGMNNVRPLLEELFRARRPLICVMALGIVVRILGPLTRSKETDPPVVVLDETGQFVISVLGGHVAGANQLTLAIARTLGATPVITTASDALGLPALDLVGRDWDWKLERSQDLTAVTAAVVRGEPVGVFQDAGRRDWWRSFGDWPAHFDWLLHWPPEGKRAAYLVITDRDVPVAGPEPTVVYRPPTLVLGVGCRRGATCVEIARHFEQIFRTHGFSPRSLREVATVTLKSDEPGLKEFAAIHHVPLRCFSLEELAAVQPLPTPSETVQAKIGIAGVCEPAAMLAAGTDSLVVTKTRAARVAMALARKADA